jgi:RNA polymerase sigma-70 factor (ECF subfamily)
MVRSLASFSADSEASSDAVSKAFVKAWIKRKDFEEMPEAAAKAWLYAAARNALIDMKRHEGIVARHSIFVPEEALADDYRPDITDKIAVSSLLDKLPPPLRKPVELKYFSGLNATQIGRALGLPSGTVRGRLHRAIELMRKYRD